MDRIRAAQLNRRVDLLTLKPYTQDGHGAGQEAYERTATFWAEVKAKAGSTVAQPQADTVAPIVTYQVRTRYRCDVSTTSCRLFLRDGTGGKELTITAAYDPDGRRRSRP
jgi:SPP1 family predicted phage head-tail adaptor